MHRCSKSEWIKVFLKIKSFQMVKSRDGYGKTVNEPADGGLFLVLLFRANCASHWQERRCPSIGFMQINVT
jgi:hypothetical protein